LDDAFPRILAALGERLPEDHEKAPDPDSPPVAELILRLSDAMIATFDGKTRARAIATLVYEPSDSLPKIESQRYFFTAPQGPIEADDLRWYLEEYFRWPAGLFKERAARIEAQLPQWGHDLFDAALVGKTAQEALSAWSQAGDGVERRFSMMVDSALPEGASQEEQVAASALLELPRTAKDFYDNITHRNHQQWQGGGDRLSARRFGLSGDRSGGLASDSIRSRRDGSDFCRQRADQG
jgi:hypothetical protein